MIKINDQIGDRSKQSSVFLRVSLKENPTASTKSLSLKLCLGRTMAEPSISGAKQKSSLKAVVALLGDLLEQRLDGDIGLDSLLQGEGTVPIALTLLVGADKVREVPGTIDEVHGKKVPRASKEVGE